MIKISSRDTDLFEFTFKLSNAVDGTNPSISDKGEVVFKSSEGYDCGVVRNTASDTAYVYIYSLTPKTLYLPDLTDGNLDRAVEFIKSQGRDKSPYTPNTDRELDWQ